MSVEGEPRDAQGRWTSSGSFGSVHVHRGELPSGLADEESREFETDQGHKGWYNVGYDAAGDAHVGDVTITGDDEEETPAHQALNSVGVYHVKRHIASVEHGALEERAIAADWDRMTPEQQQDEMRRQHLEYISGDKAKLDQIHRDVDAAVAGGFRPGSKFSYNDLPENLKDYASPKSMDRVRDRFAHHGLVMKASGDSTKFAKLFGGIAAFFGKDSPTGDDVHVVVPMGADGKRRRAKPLMFEHGAAEKALIIKTDDDQRMAYGWASVISEGGVPHVDTQGDVIDAADLVKATTDFMADARLAKQMHDGGGIGEVLHSFPLTADLAKSLGIEADREGWIVGVKIHDDDVWKRVKDGTLGSFSIGGRASREEIV